MISQRWEETHWSRSALVDYGVTLYMGHRGKPCPSPGRSEIMTLLHTNGFHRILVQFCACTRFLHARLERNQLLRARLFPASTEMPKTAFTFSCLDTMAQLSTQGKLSAYDYYHTLRQLTDNGDLKSWNVSSNQSNYYDTN